MQRTKSKILSILLSLVMLLSLLPTTALAATYYDKVKVNDIDLQDGYYLEDNSSTSATTGANTAPTTYVAWYKGGVLTLNGYDGTDIAVQGLDVGDLTIKLIGDNTITPYRTGIQGNSKSGSITITADSSGGKLTINVSNSTQSVYGIDGDENSVTITGSADVTIIAKAENASDNSYGIKSNAAVSILGDASVNITSKTPSSTRTNACYGIYSKKDVTIDTEGTIQINVHDEAGTAEAASYGVYSLGNLTLTKVGGMTVKWKKAGVYGAPYYPITASFSGTDHAINVDETNCYASYRHGTPYTVTVENGTLTCANVVPSAKESGNFLAGDLVSITPDTKKGRSGEEIPFKEWTSSDVTLTSPTTASNSFTVPGKDVTVTAMHNPFDGAPTFTPTGSTNTTGTLTFKTVVKPHDGNEYFRLVKDGEQNDESKYISFREDNSPSTSPYEYSYETRSLPGVNQVDEGDYYVVEKLNGTYYLSEKFTVNYTATPAGNYPDSVRVYNASGAITSLDDGQCLVTNDASATSYTGGAYVARYEKSTGTLYLKDYHGVATDDRILADGDLNIVVESDSSFTTSLSSATNNLYGIQADGGTLNISGSGTLTVSATGKGNVYGIYADKGVTISAPLDVQVGKNDATETGPVYGIYTKSGAISLSSAEDKTITATGGKAPAYGVYAADNSNITISGKLTVSPSNGTFNCGIYTGSGSTITLDAATLSIQSGFDCGIYNNNGNVVIKNSPDVTLNSDKSDSRGIWTNYGGDLTIENSTVKVSANGLVAELNGNVSIKDSMVDLTRTSSNYEVIRTGNSSAANKIDLSGSGTVTLTAPGKQEYAMISGKVTATSGTKVEKGTYNSEWKNYKGEYDSANNKTVLKFVHDAPALTANIILDKTGTVDFGSKEAGYTTAPAAETVTITNNGTANTGELTIALDGANKTNFTLNKTSITDIAAGATDTFTVQPNTGLAAGNYTATVKVSGTGVTERSFNVQFTVTAPLTPIAVPTPNSVTYDGTEKTGVSDGTGYTLSGTYKATDVGAMNYTATATLDAGYKWNDDSISDKTITWNIGRRTPVATDFTFTVPADLTYDGSDKTASVTLNSPFTNSGTITPTYMKGGSVVTETKDVGTYTVKIDVAGGDNFNAGSGLNNPAWTFSITPANQNAPTGLGVAAPIASGGNGKITGTTIAMEYSTDSGFTSPAGTTCTDTETEVAPGTYYVRYKADANHNAGTAATVTVPAYGATKYTVTVTYDANGTASADKTANVVAGETVTLTATPNSGYVFDKWDNKMPSDLSIGTDGKFAMPGENVSVKATFKPADLTGTASITGELKYGAELTAKLTGSNNTGNLHYKWYQNGTTQVAANNTGKYTLTADDIGKTITVEITSDVQTGKITSSATGTIDKADGPTAPSAFTLTFTLNADGTTFTATIPTVSGGEYSFDGTNYSATNSKTDCAANTVCTGYVRIAATPTHKASAATNSTQTSPKLTVATPTFTPNGVSGFTGPQSVTISCTTAGATIHYTTDGTTPTASSTEYTTALSLTSTTTVKAIAVKAGMNDSAIATATFTKYSGGGGGGSYTPSYTVSVDKTENGTITVSPKSASKGDTVTITVKPDKGYELEDLTVLDSKGKELALTEKNGKYSFKMPAGKVEVKATFIKEAEISPFDDVSTNAYYYEAVKWAQEKGITGGIGNKLFGPNDPCTRAQIVTFLWRAAGSPAPKNTGTAFGDVKPGSFYEQAVAWAVENGITGGTGDGKFSPDATCTRAQSVTFLYRAAGSPKVSGSAEFGDVATNAYYADAVAWAAKNGITGGIGGGLFGSNNDCTRAQIVTFLYRNYQSK